MVWWLLLIAVPFLLMALIKPNTGAENARASDLDPATFPQASENAPVPLGLGRFKVRGPNTMFYGEFSNTAISKKVKTGLFTSTRIITGYKYYLTLDLGLVLGPDVRLAQVIIDGEEVFDGTNLYPSTDVALWQDSPIPATVGGVIPFDTVNLETALGMTGEQIDVTAAAEAINVQVDFSFVAEMTPLAGGGPADGTWILETSCWSGLNGTGIRLYSPDGAGSMVHNSNTSGGGLLTVNYALPVGTRSVKYGVGIYLLLPFFSILTFDDSNAQLHATITVVDTQTSNINAPELFGGRESGGGWQGDFTFYPGAFDQVVDPYLEALLGAGNLPAYRGVAHIVLPRNYIGESTNLRKMEFVLERYVNELELPFEGRVTETSRQASLMAMMYHIIVNDWSGLDVDPLLVDKASFIAAAAVLASENNGGSILISAPKAGKAVMAELLRQADGVLGQNALGQCYVKLIRDDYDLATIPSYGEASFTSMESYSKTTWKDAISSVTVAFASLEKDSDRTALAQNTALINMSGRKKTSSVSFPLCYDPETANDLAARELSQLGLPLIRCTMKANRDIFRESVGNVFKLTWPEQGMLDVVMRIKNINRGRLTDNEITIELIQDRFAIATSVVGAPVSTEWVNDRPVPLTIAEHLIVETPRFLGKRLVESVDDGEGSIIPFPVAPQSPSRSFDLATGVLSGETDYRDPENITYPLTGLLAAAYSRQAGFLTGVDVAGITIKTLVGGDFDPVTNSFNPPQPATLAALQAGEAGILYVNGEWIGYEGVTDNLNATFTLTTLHRGLLGSRPLLHVLDTRVYFLNTELLGAGYLSGLLLGDGTAFYKILDRAGGVLRDVASEAENTFALSDIANRPLRPRNLAIDGDRVVPKRTGAVMTLTWAASNREAALIALEVGAVEVPDIAETYDMELWIDGLKNFAQSQTSVTSGVTVDFTGLSGFNAEIRVYARRTAGDLKQSLNYAVFPLTFNTTVDTTALTVDSSLITVDKT